MPGAHLRAIERCSCFFWSGPVGQCEFTNAARGGGLHHLRSYTNALRGNLDEIKPPSPPSRWYFAFSFRPQGPLSGSHFCFPPLLLAQVRSQRQNG